MRGSKQRYGVLVLLTATACEAPPSRIEPPAPISKEQLVARVDRAKQNACKDGVADHPTDPQHNELVGSIEAVTQNGYADALGPLRDLPELSRQITEAAAAETVTPPERPEKPSYEKPSYEGARPVVGRCVQNYSDGIVIATRGDYYAVVGADACDRMYIRGFIEDTGETVELRNGRTAKVVRVSSRETYVDDQRAYREAIAEAKSTYQKDLAAFPSLLAQWQRDVDAIPSKQRAAVATREQLVTQWRTTAGCAAKVAAVAAPPPPATSRPPEPAVVVKKRAPAPRTEDDDVTREEPEPPVSKPARTPPVVVQQEVTGCDEVYCTLSNYEGACCRALQKRAAVAPSELPDTLDRHMISAAIAPVRARVVACGHGSEARGVVRIAAKIDAEGSPASIEVKVTPDEELGNCVASVMQAAKFPRTRTGGSFAYPFAF